MVASSAGVIHGSAAVRVTSNWTMPRRAASNETSTVRGKLAQGEGVKFKATVEEESSRQYRRDGWWVDRTLLHYFDLAVAARPNDTALVAPGERRLTFIQLDEESRRIAGNLAALGVGKGDVVSIQLPNCAEFATLHLAATRLGAVTNPLLPIYRQNELSYILRFARSRVAVIPGVYRNFDYPAM